MEAASNAGGGVCAKQETRTNKGMADGAAVLIKGMTVGSAGYYGFLAGSVHNVYRSLRKLVGRVPKPAPDAHVRLSVAGTDFSRLQPDDLARHSRRVHNPASRAPQRAVL